MKRLSLFLLSVAALLLVSMISRHKYYVSLTWVEYVESQKSLQITSRIFIDDLENVLQKTYGDTILLSSNNESESANLYLKTYLTKHLKVKINNNATTLNFIGKEYENDIAICYLEITDVDNIDTLEINNKILFDTFEDQQHIIKTKINDKEQSALLTLKRSNLSFKY